MKSARLTRLLPLVAALITTSCTATFNAADTSNWTSLSLTKDRCTSWPTPIYGQNDITSSRQLFTKDNEVIHIGWQEERKPGVQPDISDVSYSLTKKDGSITLHEQSIDTSRNIYYIREYTNITPAEADLILSAMARLMQAEGREWKPGNKLHLSNSGMENLYRGAFAQEGKPVFEAVSDTPDHPLYEDVLSAFRRVLAQRCNPLMFGEDNTEE